MARPKMKMLTSKGKVPTSPSQPLSSGKPASPLMQLAGGKKDYKKKAMAAVPSFGQTGLTGES
jgi:hypothetical protein